MKPFKALMILLFPAIAVFQFPLVAQANYDYYARSAAMKYNDKTVTPTTDMVGLGQYLYISGYTSEGNYLFRFNTDSTSFERIPTESTGLEGAHIIGLDSLDADHLWILTNTTYDLYKLNINTYEVQLICDSIANTYRSIQLHEGQLFFTKYTADNGTELWHCDATGQNPGIYVDLNPGTNASGYPKSSNPQKFFVYSGRLWFEAFDQTYHSNYYSTDGSDVPVTHFSLNDMSNDYYLINKTDEVVWKNQFYFAAGKSNETGGKMYLFASNSSLNGCQTVAQLPLSTITDIAVIHDQLWMIGNPTDVTGSSELLVYDGDTARIIQITPNKASYFNNMVEVNGKSLVFGRDSRYNSAAYGHVLYQIDSAYSAVKQNMFNAPGNPLLWPTSFQKPIHVHRDQLHLTAWSRMVALENFIHVEGLILSTDTLHLTVGQRVKLKATVYPINATFQDVYYQSSNDYSASVDASGWVEAIRKGSSEITVYDAMYAHSLSCQVYVNDSIAAALPETPTEDDLIVYNADQHVLQVNCDEMPLLCLYNLTGTVVLRSRGNSINLESIPKGLYFVQANFQKRPVLFQKIWR
ncbi:MAG: Ig-like domain-containing protein [Bacteroidales bacterium]|nr:Ig-like domain-containing protein [Bacteroidales bacterium]